MKVIKILSITTAILSILISAGCEQSQAEVSINQLAGSPATPLPATTEPAPANKEDRKCSEIVFSGRLDSSNLDLFSICSDGSNLQQLTNTPANEMLPAWSPDGSRLAYTSDASGINQVTILTINSGETEQVTFEDQNDLPKWIPGQEKIAFRSTDGQGLWWWSVVNLADKAITKMTEPSYDFFFQTPAWSPDGQKLLTMSLVEQSIRNDGSSQIHISNADGSDERALTANIWANINPAWSPDGQKIAFLSEMDGTYNNFALYSMNPDGSDQKKLTEPIFPENTLFSFSPDSGAVVIDNAPIMGKIAVIDLQIGILAELSLPEGYQAAQPAWKPQ